MRQPVARDDGVRRALRGLRSLWREALRRRREAGADRGALSRDYWNRHNVTAHRRFASAAESSAYFDWRCAQYFPYLALMPVAGFDERVVLDFGCGPGHDLVGFGLYSKPARLIGMDVAASSLAEAGARLALHGIACELHRLEGEDLHLPLADGSVDHIHCSGVLHHLRDPRPTLREFRRVLRPGGSMNVMVYNRDSVWMHLYVAYVKCVVERRYPGLALETAFARTTDGEDCPIADVYRPAAFSALAAEAGLALEFTGAAVSMLEADLLPLRFEAIRCFELPRESREFLLGLELDPHGLPLHAGRHAGIDACFRLVDAARPQSES